jgi:hypothetical protein
MRIKCYKCLLRVCKPMNYYIYMIKEIYHDLRVMQSVLLRARTFKVKCDIASYVYEIHVPTVI